MIFRDLNHLFAPVAPFDSHEELVSALASDSYLHDSNYKVLIDQRLDATRRLKPGSFVPTNTTLSRADPEAPPMALGVQPRDNH